MLSECYKLETIDVSSIESHFEDLVKEMETKSIHILKEGYDKNNKVVLPVWQYHDVRNNKYDETPFEE